MIISRENQKSFPSIAKPETHGRLGHQDMRGPKKEPKAIQERKADAVVASIPMIEMPNNVVCWKQRVMIQAVSIEASALRECRMSGKEECMSLKAITPPRRCLPHLRPPRATRGSSQSGV
jgi:hypothetical protein